MLMMSALCFRRCKIGALGAPGPADADDARPCVLQIGAEAVLMLMMLGPLFPQMQNWGPRRTRPC